jgi:hypothetical protein
MNRVTLFCIKYGTPWTPSNNGPIMADPFARNL